MPNEDLHALLERAECDIAAAARVADVDPSRPRYHFRAPGQWMDDPNGVIYHDGVYHMMYSLNPNSSTDRAGMVYKTAVREWDPESEDWTGGVTVWGHARSKDLLHWEHLPIALYPQVDKGEHFVWFGCTIITPSGNPMAIYTAVGPELRPEDTAQQWAMVGDAKLVNWTPIPSNPLIDVSIHGDEVVREWRDPFVFYSGDKVYMVLGARTGVVGKGEPAVLLYEAEDDDCLSWRYRGVLYRHPDVDVPSAECPNLVQLGREWVLLVSPHGPVEYIMGQANLEACTFDEERRGIVDHSSNYYATNLVEGADGRNLLWGAVVGFEGTVGWNGALAIPRDVEIRDGLLRMAPVEELTKLRHGKAKAVRFDATKSNGELQGFEHGVGELRAIVQVPGESSVSVLLSDGLNQTKVELAAGSLRVNDKVFELNVAGEKKSLILYLDRSLVEVFVDDTDTAVCVIPALTGDVSVDVKVNGPASAEVRRWNLDADGLFSVSRELQEAREACNGDV